MGTRSALGALAGALLVTGAAAAAAPWGTEFTWGAPRVRIGVQVQSMTPALRRYFGAPEDTGVLVVEVEKGGPAERGELRVGDVILSVGGQPVESPRDLRQRIARAPVGEALAVEIQRDGKPRTKTVEPERVEAPWADLPPRFEEFAHGARRELLRRIESLEKRVRELERALQRELDLRLGPQEKT